jgi:hypothetical protein
MFFYVTGQKRTMFLVLALDQALVLTLDLTLYAALCIAHKWKVSWWLWHWRPELGESATWVLFFLIPSNY